MNIFKLAGLVFSQLVKRTLALPTTLANAAKQRQHRVILQKFEVERLDRIRHPEKYRKR